MGGDLNTEPTFSEDDLVDFIDENKIDKSGLHFQVGMQFKLFVLDSFLFYRHTFNCGSSELNSSNKISDTNFLSSIFSN